MQNRLQYLEENVRERDDVLAEDMGVDILMVKAMRIHNGLTKEEYFSLTPEQEVFLLEHYETAEWANIFPHFPEHTINQIKTRANDLGLSRR
jgi:hypothetical protein